MARTTEEMRARVREIAETLPRLGPMLVSTLRSPVQARRTRPYPSTQEDYGPTLNNSTAAHKELAYFEKRPQAMRYALFRKNGLYIAS